MAISPSRKDTYITIQKTSGIDELNQPLDDWVDVVSLWAWHKYLSGRMSLKNGVVTAINGHSWRCDWFDLFPFDINTDMRIKTDFGVFKLNRIVPEPHEHFDLLSEENASHA